MSALEYAHWEALARIEQILPFDVRPPPDDNAVEEQLYSLFPLPDQNDPEGPEGDP